jgi:hypothetical protein
VNAVVIKMALRKVRRLTLIARREAGMDFVPCCRPRWIAIVLQCAHAVERANRLDSAFAMANLLDGFRYGKHPTARAECRENRDFSPFHDPENNRGFRSREDG